MRPPKPDAPRGRVESRVLARKPRPKALVLLEDDLRRTAEDMKRSLKRAGEAVAKTRDRIEDEMRETAGQMKRRIRTAKVVVARTRRRLKGEVRETAEEVKRGLDRARKAVAITKRAVVKTRVKLRGEVRETAAEVKRAVEEAKRRAKETGEKLGDEARFLRTWIENPLKTGAVAPSGPELARTMASYVDPALPGLVVELGPGTGPVTEALIERGVAASRLVLVEYDDDFCRLLRRRFPGALVIRGDAYGLKGTLSGRLDGANAAAVVSSLPLMTRPREQRVSLLRQALGLAAPGAPFIQFTYAAGSPVPLEAGGFAASVSKRIWRNVPPARVWVYRAVHDVVALAPRPTGRRALR